jgi:type IV pilus assembly protein PilB
MGFITDEQQELLVDEQHEHPGQLLGKVAIDMGLINEDQLVQALAEQLSLQWSRRRWRKCTGSFPSSSMATR